MLPKDDKQRKDNQNVDENTEKVDDDSTGKDCCCDSKICNDDCCKSDDQKSNASDNPDEKGSEKDREYKENFEMLQRLAAEFDNYKKRTAKEKENLYIEATKDTISVLLPVLDNLERAAEADSNEVESLKDGINMVLKQFKEVLKEIGVEEIPAKGEQFNPEVHSAVMHIESEEFGNNVVVEELQKGYKIKDKVIRCSVVKVAN